MSNIAGKAYAMNVVTPLNWYTEWWTRLTFFVAGRVKSTVMGLLTLSLIHYARWVIVKPSQFPHVSPEQPKEELSYTYMFFFSNFNGSWDQYVDSFSSAIPKGLNMFWKWNIKYPQSVPMQPFHRYITANQIWTDHYYNAYPMASSNDVKSAQKVRANVLDFAAKTQGATPDEFQQEYNRLLIGLQHDISQMGPNPVVSLSASAVERRLDKERDGQRGGSAWPTKAETRTR
jgi:hypothetical protein